MTHVEMLRASLLTLLDAVDYTNHACAPTEMVAAVLPVELINNAHDVLEATNDCNQAEASAFGRYAYAAPTPRGSLPNSLGIYRCALCNKPLAHNYKHATCEECISSGKLL